MIAPILKPEPRRVDLATIVAHLLDSEPGPGERAFASMLVALPKSSKWRPRCVDDRPPWNIGKRKLWLARYSLAAVLADCASLNRQELEFLKPGRPLRVWSVPVSLVVPFDETAQPVDLLAATLAGGEA